jgi:hypothetical protein
MVSVVGGQTNIVNDQHHVYVCSILNYEYTHYVINKKYQPKKNSCIDLSNDIMDINQIIALILAMI